MIRISRQVEEARAFLAFPSGPQGRQIVKQYEFALPGAL
jgi:ABC-type molybdate transport system substrate-binding protein